MSSQQDEATFRPSAGAMLSERYLLDAPIEQGAAGEVWRGRHASIGKRVAIKILKAEHANDEDDWATKRMLREARLLSEIQHPAVVDVLDFGEQGGCPYIVMELLEGRTLSKALKEHGPMPWAKAGPLLQQMIEGLDAAHRVGVVHRDLKPANVVLLAGDTRAKLIDFGIAGARGRTRITVDGEVLGTPHFMSPEQSRTMDLTPASDIYSFGCLAFSMLAGRPPYVGKVGDIVRQHVQAPIPAVSELVGPDVPRQVCQAIQRCMAKEPETRFQSMAQLHRALLGRPLGGAPGADTGRTRARSRQAKRGVATAVVVGGALAAGLVAAAVMVWRGGEPSPLPAASAPVQRTAPAAVPPPEAPRPEPPPAMTAVQPPAELPVEVASPKVKAEVSVPRPSTSVSRPRKPKPVAEPEPVATPEPAQVEPPPAEPEPPVVEKVGGLKNPFDAE